MDFKKAIKHLKRSDVKLASIIKEPCSLGRQGTYFWSLSRAIVFQQVSGAAGTSVFRKFETLLRSNGGFKPAVALRFSAEELRPCGLSRQKSAYLLDLAAYFHDGRLQPSRLVRADNDEVIRQLTQVKGIGPWTAEMFLMFTLLRSDVLPVDDLGIREGMRRLYDLSERPDPATMERIAEPWRPWRTVACWYLWRMLDGPY